MPKPRKTTADNRTAELFKTHISLTEWLAQIGHARAAEIRAEDNAKTERLKNISRVINIPFDNPIQFASASELTLDNPRLRQILAEQGERLCALRLIPLDRTLPKLRMRGRTIKGAFEWFLEQTIDPQKYRADIRSHSTQTNWSSIFVINKYGISGEIIRGMHYQLTKDEFDGNQTPRTFYFDYKTWKMSPRDPAALAQIKQQVKHLHIADASQRKILADEFGATFAHNYLSGYYEAVENNEFGLQFDDYSQELGQMYKDFVVNLESSNSTSPKILLTGRGASAGIASGKVKIIQSPTDTITKGAVMVCHYTTPELVNQMQTAAAIITDQGGILSHAAIVARELGKPCVVNTGHATTVLKDGQTVTVDGAKGTVEGEVIDK